MSYSTGLRCIECARTHQPGAAQYVCPDCGGNLDARYDYEAIAKTLTKASLAKNGSRTMWRYRALLPIEEDSAIPAIPIGWTPLHRCANLSGEFGIKSLLIKDEGRNPTGSLKDRPSALAVVKAREDGARIITTASSGNAGVALAGMCATMRMKSVIFVPATAPPAKLVQLQIYGAAVVLVEGNYDEAYDLCLQAARRYGWYQRGTGYNPFMSEGKKTAAFEIAEQLDWELPDKVFVAVGDGCIIGGLWKGFTDLHKLGFIKKLPQMIGVQAEGASAIADAVNGDGCVRPAPAHSVADSICVAVPRDAAKAIRAIRESRGLCIKVSDDEIVSSIVRLARSTGVFVEPAAAAAFAGLIRLHGQNGIDPREQVVIVLTGTGLKDVTAARGLLQDPIRVGPNIDEFSRIFSTSSAFADEAPQ